MPTAAVTADAKKKDASFWTDPRKTRLRRWIFYIHFYAGLIAGLLFTVVGISGSAIVFVPELRVIETPGDAIVHPNEHPLSLQTILQTVRRSRPRDYIESFSSANERDSFELTPNRSLNFRSYAPNGDRIQTFVNQYTGAIIAQYNYSHRFLQKIYDLHDNLLTGLKGRKVNAWFAILMMIASVAGLLLWWRGRRFWRLGFQYKIQASWKRQTWDLHNVGGFLFFLPLLLLAFTGIYYSFESGYAAMASALTHGPATVRVPEVSGDPARWRSLDEIIRASDAAAPDCKPTIIEFPKNPTLDISVRVHCPGDPHAVGLSYIYVDPTNARVSRVDRFYGAPLGVQIVRLMTPLHYGDVGGITTRILWIIIGLTPGLFFVSGVLMWWNRSLSKSWARRRHASEMAHVHNLSRR